MGKLNFWLRRVPGLFVLSLSSFACRCCASALNSIREFLWACRLLPSGLLARFALLIVEGRLCCRRFWRKKQLCIALRLGFLGCVFFCTKLCKLFHASAIFLILSLLTAPRRYLFGCFPSIASCFLLLSLFMILRLTRCKLM